MAYKSAPLKGKTIVITRALDQAHGFAELLKKEGANPFLFPTIKLETVYPDEDELRALKNPDSFDLILFTSANAVRHFFAVLEKSGMDAASLEADVAAVGPSTAALLSSLGFNVSIIPDEYLAGSLKEAVVKAIPRGSRLLIPRARKVSREIGSELREEGYVVTEMVVYQNVPDRSRVEEAVQFFTEKNVDAVTFTSGSTARNFVTLLENRLNLDEFFAATAVAVIGPSTAKVCEKLGIRVDVIPEDYTVPGLIDALKSYFASVGT